MGFGNDSISVITRGLRRSTGSFSERLVSDGYIGDILTGVVLVKSGSIYLFLDLSM